MGREIKRVPMDFDAPLDQEWAGYNNPYSDQSTECAACAGSGSSPEAKRFGDQWYGNAPFDAVAYGASPITLDHPGVQEAAQRNCAHSPGFYGEGALALRREARRLHELFRSRWMHHLIQVDVDALLAAGRLMDFTRTPRTDEQREIVRQKIASGGNSWLPEDNGYVPTADEVNAWSLNGIAHDSINQWVCVKARCEREGVAEVCASCDGEGCHWPSPEVKKLHDEWERPEPPTGDGWQLWQTVSDGPLSPVFATADELIEWMCQPVPVEKRKHWCPEAFPSNPWAQGWLREIADPFVKRVGWAPSLMSSGEGLMGGAEFLVNADKRQL